MIVWRMEEKILLLSDKAEEIINPLSLDESSNFGNEIRQTLICI